MFLLGIYYIKTDDNWNNIDYTLKNIKYEPI